MNAPSHPAGYRILHDNGQEYGPVNAEVLRAWVREGRAHARTRVKAEGAVDWRWLGELPELSSVLPSTNWSLALPLQGYVTSNVLRCPAHKSAACGYALNSAAAGKSADELDPSLVLFFESDQSLTPCGGRDLMIAQPRHGGVFNLGFVDGSVQQCPPEQLPGLRWEP